MNTDESIDVREKGPEAKRPRLEEKAGNERNSPNMAESNPHLVKQDSDFLYHIGYDREDCKKLFTDVKVSRFGCVLAL